MIVKNIASINLVKLVLVIGVNKMDKQMLVDLVNSLPDDVEVLPFEYNEQTFKENKWEPVIGRIPYCAGLHRQRVENNLVLKLRFSTTREGEFLRSQQHPEGLFYNLRKVPN